ncbi:Hypothetical predicted protein [Mytilus galloprovincialis]|uniref:Uncharacterized protein n=1 Tax=Mytilus galloprovincialis TaxID=29158 RepID=A0A8B6DER8_MYTGA|nr:Hypothetical predicted protein [Mytilus galloprovincialis]
MDIANTAGGDEIKEIQNGLKFANIITNAMKPIEFERFLGIAATEAISFVSATLQFLSLIFSVIDNRESQELLAIKRMYNEMNRRFDLVDNKLNDISLQINWTRVSNQYSGIERHITSIDMLLRNIYEKPFALRENGKQDFIHTMKFTCMLCATELYNGIMGVNKGFSDDILQAAMETSKNDRPKMQTFMLGLFKLLVQGITNELAYHNFVHGDDDYLAYKKQWKGRLVNITAKMHKINDEIKSKYHEQAEKDIALYSLKHPRNIMSNQLFSENLYQCLVRKYDWRDWLLVVYRPISGVNNHINHICEGYRRYGMYGRDVLVASVDQKKDAINITAADEIISRITTTYTSCAQVCSSGYSGYGSYCSSGIYSSECTAHNLDAQGVYLTIPGETRDCRIYASVGVIDSWVDLWYHGLPERLVHKRTPGSNSYSIHLFG